LIFSPLLVILQRHGPPPLYCNSPINPGRGLFTFYSCPKKAERHNLLSSPLLFKEPFRSPSKFTFCISQDVFGCNFLPFITEDTFGPVPAPPQPRFQESVPFPANRFPLPDLSPCLSTHDGDSSFPRISRSEISVALLFPSSFCNPGGPPMTFSSLLC